MMKEAAAFKARAAEERDKTVSEILNKKGEVLGRHALATQQKVRIESMIRLAQPMLARSATLLDSDDMLLGVKNGVINLSNGVFRDGRQEDLITLQTDVAWASKYEDCPMWIAFLESVQPDQEVRLWLQKFVGYLMSGLTTEQIFVVFLGDGANGKSVFVEVIKAVMGSYAKTIQFSSFSSGNKASVRNDLAGLVKARMVSANEGGIDTQLDEGLIKQLTGGDTLSARFLFKEYFSFKPNFKIVLTSNHAPRIYGRDHGIWRRLVVVTWGVTIPAEKQDRQLTTKLLKEASGILAWAVRGTQMWLREGLKDRPYSISEASELFKEEQDLIGQWLTECCKLQPNAFTASKHIYVSYTNWAQKHGYILLSQKALAMRLQARGMVHGKQGDWGWRGLLVAGEGREEL